MSIWDISFLKLLKTVGINIDLYKRYVNDEIDILLPVNPGWIFNVDTKKMEYCALKAKNDTEEPAIRTAKVL